MIQEVLLLRPDRAGDAIKSLPAIRLARRLLPQVRFSVLASTHNASLFAFESGLRVYTLPGNWSTLSVEALKELLLAFPFPKAFDVTINLLCDSFDFMDRLMVLLPTQQLYSNHQNLSLPGGTPVQEKETLNIARLLGQALKIDLESPLETVPNAPTLCEPDHAEALQALGQKDNGLWIGLCPFAGPGNRIPPLKRWKKFMHSTTTAPTVSKYILFGARADLPSLKALKECAASTAQVQICTPSSFRALGAYLSLLDGVIAVDSGPLHYAQALQVPALGFLSGGDSHRWFLKNPKDKLVKRGRFLRHPLLFEMQRAFRDWFSCALVTRTVNP